MLTYNNLPKIEYRNKIVSNEFIITAQILYITSDDPCLTIQERKLH